VASGRYHPIPPGGYSFSNRSSLVWDRETKPQRRSIWYPRRSPGMAFFSEYGTYDSGSVRRQRLCTAHRGVQAIGSKLPETRLCGSL
jgi:hypothetical protein